MQCQPQKQHVLNVWHVWDDITAKHHLHAHLDNIICVGTSYSIYSWALINFFLPETVILSQPKKKTFAGPYVGLYVRVFGRKQELEI